ncbi:MAG: formylmethanofuran dehydrogenase subunit B [Gemmataceae bacterium]|nr:formylmethanofuran dehydrogenase subunit B [Gemmataceae bacterium]
MGPTIHTDVTCTACGCVCDDLRIVVEDGRVVSAETRCGLADRWLESMASPKHVGASIEGVAVPLADAIERAARILADARSPLVYGLSRSSTAGQQAALALGEHIGAVVDTTASLGHGPSIIAVQEVGESTCTLGEVKQRADLVIFWGSDPVESHPRHFERYSVDPAGMFVPNGRRDRFIVAVDPRRTATVEQADLHLPIEAGGDFELLWALRALIRGVGWNAPSAGGIASAQIESLAARMKACRFGIVFFGLGLARQGVRTVAALLRLSQELNDFTRFYVRRMRVSGDVAGADSVLAWQTGFPFCVSYARGFPRYGPGEFSGHDMLRRGEADACLLVGSSGTRRFSAEACDELKRISTVVLDPGHVDQGFVPTVRFTTAVPGVHHVGTAYRMDEIPIPLNPFLPKSAPSDREVLSAIHGRVRELRQGGAART